MDRPTYRRLLESMVAWEQEPKLLDAEMESLLDMHKLSDLYGLTPNIAGWLPTFDLRRAAAEGWRWKAAKCADRFDFSSDVNSFSRDQMQKHCLAMVDLFSKGAFASVPVAVRYLYDPVLGNINGGT